MTTVTPPRRRARLAALAIGALALAGCGSQGSSQTGATSAQDASTVVAVSDAGGRSVLVTSDGRTLYFSDQEKGQVMCSSGACEAIWTPLTVAAKKDVTAPPKLAHRLGTVGRPDGSTQVTLGGRPLYTFSFDHGAGQVNGDGLQDSFEGTDFTWHAATPGGRTAPAAPAPSSSPPYGSRY